MDTIDAPHSYPVAISQVGNLDCRLSLPFLHFFLLLFIPVVKRTKKEDFLPLSLYQSFDLNIDFLSRRPLNATISTFHFEMHSFTP